MCERDKERVESFGRRRRMKRTIWPKVSGHHQNIPGHMCWSDVSVPTKTKINKSRVLICCFNNADDQVLAHSRGSGPLSSSFSTWNWQKLIYSQFWLWHREDVVETEGRWRETMKNSIRLNSTKEIRLSSQQRPNDSLWTLCFNCHVIKLELLDGEKTKRLKEAKTI